jgi:uncharacterized membrane protein YkvA (DUF1232 family)
MLSRLRRLARLAGREVTILWFACRNPATPLLVKLGAGVLAVYLFSPIDFIPDALPVLGWLDDATILAFGIPALLKLMPAAALDEARGSSERFLSRWAFWRKA